MNVSIIVSLIIFGILVVYPYVTFWRYIQQDNGAAIQKLGWMSYAINLPTFSGDSPLMYCLKNDKKKSFSAILEAGVNPNESLSSGQIVTCSAAAENDVYWLEKVMEHNGDPNIVTLQASHSRRANPLNYAISKGRLRNIKFLVDAGANVNFCSDDVRSPLATAADRRDFDVVLFLLDHGADPHLREIDSRSFAAAMQFENPNDYVHDEDRKKSQKVIDRLRDFGIDVKKHHWEGKYLVWDTIVTE